MADDGIVSQKEAIGEEDDVTVTAAVTADNNERSGAVGVDSDEVAVGLLVEDEDRERLVTSQIHVEDKVQEASHSLRSYENLIASFGGKRKGPWSQFEQSYAVKLIECFIVGYFDIPRETKLRDFLAQKLFCEPMRITKWFHNQGISTRHAARHFTGAGVGAKEQVELQLQTLELQFLQDLDFQTKVKVINRERYKTKIYMEEQEMKAGRMKEYVKITPYDVAVASLASAIAGKPVRMLTPKELSQPIASFPIIPSLQQDNVAFEVLLEAAAAPSSSSAMLNNALTLLSTAAEASEAQGGKNDSMALPIPSEVSDATFKQTTIDINASVISSPVIESSKIFSRIGDEDSNLDNSKYTEHGRNKRARTSENGSVSVPTSE